MNYHVFRQADFIESAIKNLKNALWQGGIIVTVILFLYLYNFRASFISLLAMPLSLLGGLMVLKIFGIGINALTLGGLAIAIGIVVDDAIIDVENVFRRQRPVKALPPPEPASSVVFKGSTEIRNSIVYATFIIIIAFFPVFLLSGFEGRIFTPLGIAFISSVLFSLLVAVTITPVLCYVLLTHKYERELAKEAPVGQPSIGFASPENPSGTPDNPGPDSEHKAKKESALVGFLKRIYERVLYQSLNHFYLVMGISLVGSNTRL